MSDLILVRFAHIDNLDPKRRVIQNAFKFLNSDFVRVHSF